MASWVRRTCGGSVPVALLTLSLRDPRSPTVSPGWDQGSAAKGCWREACWAVVPRASPPCCQHSPDTSTGQEEVGHFSQEAKDPAHGRRAPSQTREQRGDLWRAAPQHKRQRHMGRTRCCQLLPALTCNGHGAFPLGSGSNLLKAGCSRLSHARRALGAGSSHLPHKTLPLTSYSRKLGGQNKFPSPFLSNLYYIRHVPKKPSASRKQNCSQIRDELAKMFCLKTGLATCHPRMQVSSMLPPWSLQRSACPIAACFSHLTPSPLLPAQGSGKGAQPCPPQQLCTGQSNFSPSFSFLLQL